MRFFAAVCALVASASACNYEQLSGCLPPTAVGDDAFCTEHAAYEDCATQSNCLAVDSVQGVITSGRAAFVCDGGSDTERPDAPRILTNAGNVHINAKKVCFSEAGESTVCASDLALGSTVDEILTRQGVLADKLNETSAQIIDVVKTTLGPLEVSLAAANELAANQGVAIENLQDELNGHCGRHCYVGEYVKTACADGQKTVCAACEDGTYSQGGLLQQCPTCSDCNNRQFLTSDCTLTQDTGCTACTPCPEGKFAPKTCTDTETTHCEAHTECTDEQFAKSDGTPWFDTDCVACTECEDGTWQSKKCLPKKDAVCSNCKTCGKTEVEAKACTATTNTKCIKQQNSCAALRDAGVDKDGMYLLTIGWTYCILDKSIGGGGWHMVLNVHPSDGHSAAWAAKLSGFVQDGNNQVDANKPTFWAGDIQYSPNGADKTPFGADYSSKVNKKFAAKEIMVVAHKNQEGDVLSNEDNQKFMWKRWEFLSKYEGKTWLWLYRNTFRDQLTGGGHKQENLYGNDVSRCVVFAYHGNVLINFYYSNNGARLILDGQSLSCQGCNDDSSFGLGMEFSSYTNNNRFSGSSGSWCFDASYHETSGSDGGQGKDVCSSLTPRDDYVAEYAMFVR